MKPKALLIKLAIGVVLATLPLAVCWGVAEAMVRLGVEAAQPPAYLAQKRRNIAGIVLVIGFAMSAVAWCGLGLYVLATLWGAVPGLRHERRLNAMRERGEIDF
ncbi:MAG: hypothetical protein AAGA29_10440 [Planctomycetota bacterium]